jgi:hypothetical protein
MPVKKKDKRPAWTGYWLLGRRPFADEQWLLRWREFKKELSLRVPR